MKKPQNPEFVGIVEHINQGASSYDYCNLNIPSGGMASHASIKSLGEMIAYHFGNNFRQIITYEPPQGIHDLREIGLSPKRYHQLSVLEKNRFERAVLNNLKGTIMEEKQ